VQSDATERLGLHGDLKISQLHLSRHKNEMYRRFQSLFLPVFVQDNLLGITGKWE
jgi:hypothetical protein